MDDFKPYSDPRDVEMESLIHERLSGMGRHLHATVREGVVTLTGAADDLEEKREIETAVRMIGGVRRVIDEIRIASVEDKFTNWRDGGN